MQPTPDSRDRLQIWEILAMVAGVALGLALFLRTESGETYPLVNLALGVFGGLALAGPPLLLWKRRRRKLRRPFGPGQILWFAQGTAAWLLFPPIAYIRSHTRQPNMGPESMSAMCFAYGTPLMSLYIVVTLLAGDWLHLRRKSKRKRRPRSWTETVGLILGLGWACTGAYLIAMFWIEDIRR